MLQRGRSSACEHPSRPHGVIPSSPSSQLDIAQSVLQIPIVGLRSLYDKSEGFRFPGVASLALVLWLRGSRGLPLSSAPPHLPLITVLQLAVTHHYIYDISITDTTHKLLLFPIAFLLVFRSNTAYGDLILAPPASPLLLQLTSGARASAVEGNTAEIRTACHL